MGAVTAEVMMATAAKEAEATVAGAKAVEAAAAVAASAAVAEAALRPRDVPKATLQRKHSFDRQMKFLLKAEQEEEEAPL